MAAHGDAGDFAWIRGRFETASDPQTEQRHLAALADFPDPRLVRTILEGTLDGSVRTQDGPYLIRRALTNRHAGPDAWDFLTSRWDDVAAAFPSNSLSRMLAGVTALDRTELAARVHDFIAVHPVPQGAKQVAQHSNAMVSAAANLCNGLGLQQHSRFGNLETMGLAKS